MLGLVLATIAALPQEPGAGARAPVPRRSVAHMRVAGQLDTGTLGHLQRVVRAARGEHAALLIELDTPGGEVGLMWQLARQIDAAAADLKVVAWIHDRAVSAGALLAMSCDEIWMSPSATIGSALPITIGPQGVQPADPDPAVLEKHLSAFRADFRAWAESHGRPPELAEAMVDARVRVYRILHDNERRVVGGTEWDDLRQRGEDVSLLATIVDDRTLLNLSASEAVEYGMANGLASEVREVLDKAGLAGAEVVLYERTRSEDLASFLASIRFLLLVAALVAIYAELKIPGFGVPGLIGIACLALLLFGQYLVGLADVPHVVAVALGIVLIGVEVFVLPGSIWAGALGALLVLGGLVFSGLGPAGDFAYGLDRRLAVDAALNLLLGLAAAAVAAGALSRVLPRAPVLRGLVLTPTPVGDDHGRAVRDAGGEAASIARPGAKGTALTDLRPVGKVRLDSDPDREYEARAPAGPLERGVRVVVVDTTGGRLVVETHEEGIA